MLDELPAMLAADKARAHIAAILMQIIIIIEIIIVMAGIIQSNYIMHSLCKPSPADCGLALLKGNRSME